MGVPSQVWMLYHGTGIPLEDPVLRMLSCMYKMVGVLHVATAEKIGFPVGEMNKNKDGL